MVLQQMSFVERLSEDPVPLYILHNGKESVLISEECDKEVFGKCVLVSMPQNTL